LALHIEAACSAMGGIDLDPAMHAVRAALHPGHRLLTPPGMDCARNGVAGRIVRAVVV
jgi:hypothetical protein